MNLPTYLVVGVLIPFLILFFILRSVWLKKTKVEEASIVGKVLAERAVAAGISDVVFDRGGYLYHGRVKSLAEGARNGGLKF